MEAKHTSSPADEKPISMQSDNIADDQSSPTTAGANNGEDEDDFFLRILSYWSIEVWIWLNVSFVVCSIKTVIYN